MEIEFVLQEKVVLTRKILEKINIKPSSFSIPINSSPENSSPENDLLYIGKKIERDKDKNSLFSGEEDEIYRSRPKNKVNSNYSSNYKRGNKINNYYENDEIDNEDIISVDSNEESEEYEESENEMNEEDIGEYDDDEIDESNNSSKKRGGSSKIQGDSSETSSKNISQRLLRKYGSVTENQNQLYGLNMNSNKKAKKELTEEEIAKKTEQARLRKLHAKKLIEEEKREAVERILNEDGRKLRERQKKQNEELKKKTKLEEEKLKNSLTKVITKYQSDGKIYVRFPQGFLLPSVFLQHKKEIKPMPKCYVEGCQNLKKYTDPKTGFPYCSVECFKKLREQI